MSCYYHPEREETAQCDNCGKLLCRECASLYETPLCADCAKQGAAEWRKELVTLSAVSIAIAVFAFVAYTSSHGLSVQAIAPAILFGCVPFGWRALTSITPKMFLVLPIVGWLIYFLLKFIAAACIGWIACPVKIIKIRRIISSVEEKEAHRMDI